jgi:phosphoserine phosphatase RsbU/P
MFEEAAYAALELTLEPGDRHILYTDGILEATNRAQEMYGADRFMHFMKSNKSLSADPFADTFLAEITNWTGQSADHGQQDDITLLLFDFKRVRIPTMAEIKSPFGPARTTGLCVDRSLRDWP